MKLTGITTTREPTCFLPAFITRRTLGYLINNLRRQLGHQEWMVIHKDPVKFLSSGTISHTPGANSFNIISSVDRSLTHVAIGVAATFTGVLRLGYHPCFDRVGMILECWELSHPTSSGMGLNCSSTRYRGRPPRSFTVAVFVSMPAA